jgi:hypothetical protein
MYNIFNLLELFFVSDTFPMQCGLWAAPAAPAAAAAAPLSADAAEWWSSIVVGASFNLYAANILMGRLARRAAV